MILGDFNDLLSQEEKRSKHPHPQYLLNGFHSVTDDCGLLDLDMDGYQFTWSKSSYTDCFVEERLDRGFGN